MVGDQSCPSSNPLGDMPICACRARSSNLNLGCGIWKSPDSHCSGSVLPTQGLIQWPGSSSPRNLMDAIPGNPLSEDPNMDPCISGSLMNKVLEAVTLTQEPEGIHTSLCPGGEPTNNRPSNSLITSSNAAQLHSTGNLISPANKHTKVFIFWNQSVTTRGSVCSNKCTGTNARLHGSWRNMTQPMETKITLVSDCKEMQFYDLPWTKNLKQLFNENK